MSDNHTPKRIRDNSNHKKPHKMSKKRRRALIKRRLLVFNMVVLVGVLVAGLGFFISAFAKGVNLKAKTGKDEILLTWNEKKVAQKYDVLRSQDDESQYVKISTVGQGKYTDTDIEPGHAYYYKIQSENFVGKSTSNSQVCFLKPQPVDSLEASSKNLEVTLKWDEVPGAQQYHIERKDKDASKYQEIQTTEENKYTDKDVEENKEYDYRVFSTYKAAGKEIASLEGKEAEVRCTNIDPDGKMIALTFDDGPGKYTKELVDCFKKYNAHGTFFVLGQNAQIFEDEIKAEQEAGCEIASHTWDHPNLDNLGASAIAEQVKKTDDVIEKLTGSPPDLIRTPYGATSQTTKDTVKKPIIFWSIDTLDWKTRNTESTVNVVMEEAQDGDIVLMHDIHEPTKNAAIQLIPKLIDKGFQLVTVSELAEYKNVELEPGTVYSEIGKKY